MNWFYAENGQQRGPVSDSDLAALAENGSLKGDTLLWREGLPDWQPVNRVRPDLIAAAGTPLLGGVAVPEQNKDLLVQQMREGVIGELTAPGSLRYVGFWWRLLSWIIDYIIMLVAQQVIQMVAFVLIAAMGAAMGGGNGSEIFTAVAMLGVMAFALALNAWYHTWMVSRFGGTLGKMALGFKVVTMDGRSLSWPRSLARWAVSGVLNHIIWLIIMVVPMLLILFIGLGGFQGLNNMEQSPAFVFWVIGMVVAFFVGLIGGGFPWWMAGLDKEKRALHDRICATRVVWK
ncbi:putative RDD family membrane protein YckC [Roseimicrobium gellanilyticum]|uniref:Putative RDD family membrane protein YckC n=1 Tax=Roseimicrobium gellanilyticum TaxID=748857 RepID=A0A366HIL7_9BACT|nr:RDD family protein [Roseimicrobium gellanilyticum]RBP42606.1 putative RDD family membrane protein YckC [Roseimicrobium gellanilyticum]